MPYIRLNNLSEVSSNIKQCPIFAQHSLFLSNPVGPGYAEIYQLTFTGFVLNIMYLGLLTWSQFLVGGMELTTIGLTLVSYLALGFATMSGTLLGNFGCITVNGLGYISNILLET